MPAILDTRNGRRFGQAQFVNEVVDAISSEEGRRPCYDLLDALTALREEGSPASAAVTLGDDRGVPGHLRGARFELVEGESDAERSDRTARQAVYLKPEEAADLLRVDARTVKRWLQQGKLSGFKTPGGHWRVSRDGLEVLAGSK
jgi:excisionase family DNA binding protein